MGGVGDAADDYWLRGRDGVGADSRVMWAFTLAAGCAAAIAADAAATTVDTVAADAPLSPLHSRCAVDVAADAAADAATIVNPAATDAPAVATGLPLRCRRCVPTAVAGAADVAAAAAAATVTAATVDAAAGTRCPQRMRGRVTPRPHVRVAARERDAQVRRTTAVMVSGGERDAHRTKLSLGAEWTDGGRKGRGRAYARHTRSHPRTRRVSHCVENMASSGDGQELRTSPDLVRTLLWWCLGHPGSNSQSRGNARDLRSP